jgi:hypothetical protein
MCVTGYVRTVICRTFIPGILLNASTSTDDNDLIDIEMQCDMLFIVSTLCEGDPHRKVMYVDTCFLVWILP